MAVILQITAGPARGRKTFLRKGQGKRAHRGAFERADFDVPQDTAMAPVHFQVEFAANVCRLRDLQSGVGTLLNGEAVGEAVLAHGDQITAGATTFSVHIEGSQPVALVAAAPLAAAAAPPPSTPPKPGASGFKRVEPALAQAVCARYELEEEAQPLLDTKQTPREFVLLLGKQQLFASAVRFLAHALPKREAVWWACRCLRASEGNGFPLHDKRAVGAAEQWVGEPSEDHRRAAGTAADATKHETAAGWAAASAFWSGGSIAAPGEAEVPPKETLTAQAVVVAITLAASAEPRKMAARFAEFCALGGKVADGLERWPEPNSG